MSFLCTTINKEVTHQQCLNECQYVFKSSCIDRMNEAYNQALEDFEKCAIQQSLYTETEEGWSGMTIDTKTIKSIKEQLAK